METLFLSGIRVLKFQDLNNGTLALAGRDQETTGIAKSSFVSRQ